MRKLSFATLVAGGMMLAGARAWAAAPVQVSLFPPVQIVGSANDVSGLRLNLIYGVNANVTGVDLGLVNRTTGNLTGLELGAVNIANGAVRGVQAGLANQAGDLSGLQLGIYNGANIVRGVQIGLINLNFNGHPFKFLPIVNWAFGGSAM